MSAQCEAQQLVKAIATSSKAASGEAEQRGKAERQSSSDFLQISICYAATQVSLPYNKRTEVSNLRVAGGGSYSHGATYYVRQSRSARCGAMRSATRQPAADSKQHTTSCSIQASRWNKITTMKTTVGTVRDQTIVAASSLPATKWRVPGKVMWPRLRQARGQPSNTPSYCYTNVNCKCCSVVANLGSG